MNQSKQNKEIFLELTARNVQNKQLCPKISVDLIKKKYNQKVNFAI